MRNRNVTDAPFGPASVTSGPSTVVNFDPALSFDSPLSTRAS